MKDKFYYYDGTSYYDKTRRDKIWLVNGKRHREDGPAVEGIDGYKAWYINGKLHREDGPAVECGNGCVRYYLNDEYYSKKNFNKKIAKINGPTEDKYYYSDGTTSQKEII